MRAIQRATAQGHPAGERVPASPLAAVSRPAGRARVLLCDSSPRVRAALRTLLEDEGMRVVAEAGCASEVVAAARHATPDVVLVELRPSVREALRATAELRATVPGARVVVTTVLPGWVVLEDALRAGAFGVAEKGGQATVLLGLVERALADARAEIARTG